jgi:PhnB protein
MPKRSQNPGRNDPRKNHPRQVDQLDRAITTLFARADGYLPDVDAALEPLVNLAAALRHLPRESFKAILKSEFEGSKPVSAIAEPKIAVPTTASPRLTFKNAARAIDFYTAAFDAREISRFQVGDHIPHAELAIGDSIILVTEEWPEGNRFSAETLGNSPVLLSLRVADVDSFAARAVAAGMKVKIPIRNQFYGSREGTFADPFGYLWSISTVIEEMSIEEMHRRMKGETSGPEGGNLPAESPSEDSSRKRVNPIRPGFQTVTPYLVAQDAEAVINFVKQVFHGEETFRDVGSAGGYHCELRVEDSMLMIGGGGPKLAWKGDSVLGAFHIYVRDCDATCKRALEAGAKSLAEPKDQEYGERSGSVIDPAGNSWYIATRKTGPYKWEGAPTIQPYLHPLRAEPVVNFLRHAFGAEELGRFTSPDGVVHHTTLKIGTAYLEMGEAHGPYQPMKSMFYLYVPNCDAVYHAAIAAGAKSIHEPADQPYGDRVGAITDIFGNQWWIGTHIKDQDEPRK